MACVFFHVHMHGVVCVCVRACMRSCVCVCVCVCARDKEMLLFFFFSVGQQLAWVYSPFRPQIVIGSTGPYIIGHNV